MKKLSKEKIIIIIMAIIIVFLEGSRENYYIQSNTFPFLQSKYYSKDWKETGSLRINGTWVIDNDKIAYPAQTSEINCYKPDMTCTEVTAMFGNTDEDGVGKDNLLIVNSTIHYIDKIDDNIIQYTEKGNCGQTVGTINISTGDVSEITVSNNSKKCLLSAFGIKASKNLYSHLADGIEVSQIHDKKIRTFKDIPLFWTLGKIFSIVFNFKN